MRKRSSSSLFFIFVLIIALILSACSQSQETQKQTDAPAQSSGEQTEQPTQKTEEPTEQPTTTEEPTTAHEHSFGEWAIVQKADYFEEGIKERTCACGEKETEAIPIKEGVYSSEDALLILKTGNWRSISDYDGGYYCFYTSDSAYFSTKSDSKVNLTWYYSNGGVYTFAGTQSVNFQLKKENGLYVLKWQNGKDYFVREADYEIGTTIYGKAGESTTQHVDLEKDEVKIDLDKSIILTNGDVIVEITALIQESENIAGKGKVLTKGVLFKITNNAKMDADILIYPIYIGNESGSAVSPVSNHLKPGKTKQEFWSFSYQDYNGMSGDALKSLYDLTTVNGTLHIQYYPDEYHYQDGPIYDFDLSKYSNEIKTAIDDYVKTH